MKKNTLIALFILVVTAILPSCGGGSSNNSPAATVNKAFDYIAAKDFKGAASLYVSGENKPLTEEESQKLQGMLAMASKQYEENGGIKEISILEEKISEDGNTAVVKQKIVYKDGTEDTNDTDLVKVDGKWYFSLKMN